MTGPVAVLVPAKRPQNIAPLLSSLVKSTREPWAILFVTDPEDVEVRDAIDDARRLCDRSVTVQSLIVRGNYARKVNTATKHPDAQCPLLFVGADDLRFHPGWLEAAADRLSTRVGVVGTNDLCNPKVIAGEHATHFLVSRDYVQQGTIDEPGKLLHEGYPHEWVDNEFIETAKSRGAYAHASDSLVEHLHPMAGKAPTDELYDGMPRRMKVGRRIYQRRRQLWQSSAS